MVSTSNITAMLLSSIERIFNVPVTRIHQGTISFFSLYEIFQHLLDQYPERQTISLPLEIHHQKINKQI